jgi:outer membrane immunogenic protein
MKCTIRAGLAGLGLLALSTASTGADAQPPAPAPTTTYNWTGLYAGFNTGPTFGTSTPIGLYSSSFTAFSFSAGGWLGGLTFGDQLQSGHTVLGIEGDIDWTSISGHGTGNLFFNGAPIGTATLNSKVTSISTFRTRLGYADRNWLWYATAGFALTDEKSTLTSSNGFICGVGTVNSPPCSTSSNLHVGVTAGAGVEYGIKQNLSTRFEYIWVGAGAFNTLNENILRAGLVWRFGM